MEDLDFPTTKEGLPGYKPQTASNGKGGSWPVRVVDVYTTFNSGWGKDGTNGLMVDIVTEKNGKARSVFYPEGTAQRTVAFLEALDNLGIAPHAIGGWKKLRGYRLRWTTEERSFTPKGTDEVKSFQVEYPVEVIEAPAEGEDLSKDAPTFSGSPMDILRAMGIGKTKSEIKFAVAKDATLTAEFSDRIADGALIEDLLGDGVWVMDGNKIAKGPNF